MTPWKSECKYIPIVPKLVTAHHKQHVAHTNYAACSIALQAVRYVSQYRYVVIMQDSLTVNFVGRYAVHQHHRHDSQSFRKPMLLFSFRPNCDWRQLKLKFAVSPLRRSAASSLLVGGGVLRRYISTERQTVTNLP
jgi:hypothetical protein